MKRIFLTAILASLLLPAFAQDQAAGSQVQAAQPPAAQAAGPEAPAVQAPTLPEKPLAYGLVQNGSRKEEGRDFLVLADPAGGEILFSAEAEPSADRIKAVLALTSALRGWSGSTMGEIRVVNYADRFQLNAIAQRFMAGTQEVAQRIPGGLQFFYKDGAFEYDFRFKAGDFFVRVRGLYSSSADLALILQRVLKDPAAYVTAVDPLYALKKFEEEETKLAAHEKAEAELKAALVAAEGKLAQADSQLRSEAAALSEKLAAEQFRSIVADAAALNGGKAVRADIVRKILDLRSADPKFDKTKAVAKLKEAGMALTQREADAVFLAAFGE